MGFIYILVMSRNAFLDTPVESFDTAFSSKRILVATTEKIETKWDNVEFISEDLVYIVSELQNEPGKNIWLFSCVLIDAFIKADVVVNGVTYTKRTRTTINTTNANTSYTSNTTDLSFIFDDTSTCNKDVNNWNISNVHIFLL